MSYRRLSPILALLAALVLIGAPAPAPTVAAPSRQLHQVAYGADFLISGTTAPIYIAIEKGYFAEGGIEVTVSRGFGSADAVKRAATGQADIVRERLKVYQRQSKPLVDYYSTRATFRASR